MKFWKREKEQTKVTLKEDDTTEASASIPTWKEVGQGDTRGTNPPVPEKRSNQASDLPYSAMQLRLVAFATLVIAVCAVLFVPRPKPHPNLAPPVVANVVSNLYADPLKLQVYEILDVAAIPDGQWDRGALADDVNDLVHLKLNLAQLKERPLIVDSEFHSQGRRTTEKLLALGPRILPALESYLKDPPDDDRAPFLAIHVLKRFGDKGLDSLLHIIQEADVHGARIGLAGKKADYHYPGEIQSLPVEVGSPAWKAQMRAAMYQMEYRFGIDELRGIGSRTVVKLTDLIETGSNADKEFAWQTMISILIDRGYYERSVKLPRSLRSAIIDRFARCRQEELALMNGAQIHPAPGQSLWYFTVYHYGAGAALESAAVHVRNRDEGEALRKTWDRTWQLGNERAALVRALGSLTPATEENVADMRKILENEDDAARAQAAYQLGIMLGWKELPQPFAKEAIELLRKHAADKDNDVRVACWAALCEAAASHKECLVDLKAASNQDDQRIRDRAGDIYREVYSGKHIDGTL
jgi:hypothetical protein